MKGVYWYEKVRSDFSTDLRKSKDVAMKNFSQYLVEKKKRQFHFNKHEMISRKV